MIRFTVITAPSTGIPAGFSMLFGPGGGTIGRSHRCTWQLSDIDCLVSRVHAEITTDDGVYRIIDRSTNGLFINQSEAALGHGQSVQLHHGDNIRVGAYLLQISVEADRVASGAHDLGPADFLHTDMPLPDLAFTSGNVDTLLPFANANTAADFSAAANRHAAASNFTARRSLLSGLDNGDDDVDLEQQLRLALRPFAGNMVMDFNQRELLALVTYLVGRAKHLNATAT